MRRQLEHQGRVWLRQAVTADEMAGMDALIDIGNRPGTRIRDSAPLFDMIRKSAWVDAIARLWPLRHPVRALAFDKSADSNWGVPWHQDRVIAVKEKAEAPGFSSWSNKSGLWHCEPPLEFLDQMLFVRVHFDRNSAQNGAMEIALQSHKAGMIPAGDAAKIAQSCETEVCQADRGDILVLNMLTLHRSCPSKVASSRRALRVDFAPDTLPPPLSWA